MEQLRTHCAREISELERNLGSQQELSAALDQTHPELVTDQETQRSSVYPADSAPVIISIFEPSIRTTLITCGLDIWNCVKSELMRKRLKNYGPFTLKSS